MSKNLMQISHVIHGTIQKLCSYDIYKYKRYSMDICFLGQPFCQVCTSVWQKKSYFTAKEEEQKEEMHHFDDFP